MKIYAVPTRLPAFFAGTSGTFRRVVHSFIVPCAALVCFQCAVFQKLNKTKVKGTEAYRNGD